MFVRHVSQVSCEATLLEHFWNTPQEKMCEKTKDWWSVNAIPTLPPSTDHCLYHFHIFPEICGAGNAARTQTVKMRNSN